MSAPPLSHSAEQVRQFDRDRFVTALFAPADRREHLFALYAFNQEVAKIRETVSEATMGLIRLQWWRDAIAAIVAGHEPPGQPVAQALAEAIRAHHLPLTLFETLLEGRERDLESSPPADLAALETYAEQTSSALVELALLILGARDEASRTAGRHVGIGWALTGILRAVPFHARTGRLYLPQALLDVHGVQADALNSGDLPGVARHIADVAALHLKAARGQKVPRQAAPALLTATLADRYLARLRRSGHDLFDAGWSVTNPPMLRLAFKALRGHY